MPSGIEPPYFSQLPYEPFQIPPRSSADYLIRALTEDLVCPDCGALVRLVIDVGTGMPSLKVIKHAS